MLLFFLVTHEKGSLPSLSLSGPNTTFYYLSFTQAGGDVTITDRKNESALFKAAAGGYVKCVKVILETHSDIHFVNATNSDGLSLYEAAMEGNRVEILQAITEKGATLPISNRNPLMIALDKNISTDILEYAIFQGAPVNKTDDKEISPLIKATKQQKLEAMASLIRFGADINHHTFDGQTVLMTAIQAWSYSSEGIIELYKVVKLLIKSGSDINLVDRRGWNALMYALALNPDKLIESRHNGTHGHQLEPKLGCPSGTKFWRSTFCFLPNLTLGLNSSKNIFGIFPTSGSLTPVPSQISVI